VRLGIPGADRLNEELKSALGILERLGVQVFELSDQWNAHGVPLVGQFSTSAGTLSLFGTSLGASCPGPSWLDAEKSGTWVTSTTVPRISVENKRIDAGSWLVTKAGAVVLEIANELDGTLIGFGARFKALLESRLPAMADLLRNDHATQITYSDRYLRSPWSVALLNSFLQVFKSDVLKNVKIQTAGLSASQPGYLFSHDWVHGKDLSAVTTRWLTTALRAPVSLDIAPNSRDVQHSRVLTVHWASGIRSRIILDQGMGYWRMDVSDRSHGRFDFGQSVQNQIHLMGEKVKAAKMVQSGTWSTLMTVIVRT
jgi:hypothetical protein